MMLPFLPSVLSPRPSQMTSSRSMCLRKRSCGPPSSGIPMEWRLVASVSFKVASHLLLVYGIFLQGAQ